MQLESFVAGSWRAGDGGGAALRDATTGEVIAHASSAGPDARAMLEYAREVGGRESAPTHLSRACVAAEGAREAADRI